MKRYKLLKDLPTFKAGEEFHISKNGNLVHTRTSILIYNKNLLKNRPNILEEWFGEIEEEIKVELSGQYIPPKGKKCWGPMFSRLFGAEPDEIDGSYAEVLAEVGLSFKTEKECQKFIDYLKAYQILRRDQKGFKPDWTNYSSKYYVFYHHEIEMLQTDFVRNMNEGIIYFDTKEDAEASIKAHEKEWKIYLGVEK